MTGESSGGQVKPVINALRILRYLQAGSGPVRATAIARDLSLNPSTCFNILKTLAAESVLAFDPVAKTYGPGPGLLDLVGPESHGQRIAAIAQPMMEELAREKRVTVTLWRRLPDKSLVLLSLAHSPAELRIDIRLGQRLAAYVAATGRLAAAHEHLPPDAQARIFAGLPWSVPLPLAEWQEQVRQSGERGWAVDPGNFTAGIVSIAAPVRVGDDGFAMSLSALAFSSEVDGAALAAIGHAVKTVAANISAL